MILTQNGLGYAVCPEAVCAIADRSRVHFYPFDPPHTTQGILLWKRQYVFSPAAARFLDFAKEYLAPQAGPA